MENISIPAAVAVIRGEAHGMVKFYQRGGKTLVDVQLRDLPESDSGFFALHIHEGGDCEGEGYPNTGGHYNPGNVEHPRHAGDLPPLLNSGGRANMQVVTNRFRVDEVIGKTVVIHSQPDDFRTQPAGNAGEKIACGVIRRGMPAFTG